MIMRVLFAMIPAISLVAAPALAKVFNATKQFTTTANSDTTTWSYRYGDTGGHDGNYTLLTATATVQVERGMRTLNLPQWYSPSEPFGVPDFWADKGATVIVVSNDQDITVPAKTLVYHPGYGYPAVLSFLAPKTGTATVSYDYTHLDWSCGGAGTGIAWSIEKNFGNGALASGTLYSPDSMHIATTGTQTLTVAVTKSDRLNFIVDGVANPPYCDSTGLATSVSIQ